MLSKTIVSYITLFAAFGGMAFAKDGEGTTYSQGGAAGSCGTVASDGDMVAALSTTYQGDKQNCGKKIRVTNAGPSSDNSVGGQGNSVEVEVRDTCAGCATDDVDLSTAAWNQLTDNSYPSRVKITWDFI